MLYIDIESPDVELYISIMIINIVEPFTAFSHQFS